MVSKLKVRDKVWYLPYTSIVSPQQIEIEVIYINTERIIRANSDNENTSITYRSTDGKMIQDGELFLSKQSADLVYKERFITEQERRIEQTKYSIEWNKKILKQLNKELKETLK